MKTRMIALIITIFGMVFQIPVQMTVTPAETSIKTYSDYRAVTDVESEQYELLQSLENCDDGMLRDPQGYIAAALGKHFGDIGTRWWFFLDTGKIIRIIKADEKLVEHTTDPYHILGTVNEIIEFYVDSSKIPRDDNGYCWSGNFNNNPEFEGKIIGWVRVIG